jgi:hypothetical protein
METEIKLVLFMLDFLVIAFVITTVVFLGPRVLGGRSTRAQFWGMFGVTCIILLILRALA